MNNTDKVVRYISECKDHKIEVLPPDINESVKDFSVVDDRIRFGLAAVKNVGGAALDSVIEEREAGGKYTSLSNFCSRIDSRRVNSRVIESLIKSGSFDSLGCKRSQLMASVDKAMEQAKAIQRDRQSGQMSLFAVAPEVEPNDTAAISMPDIEEWDERQRLAFEKETVGFYITGHPLDDTISEIRTIVDGDIHDLGELADEQAVRIGGLIKTCKQLKSKKGDPMAFLSVEDTLEAVEVVVFPDTYSRCYEILTSTEPVIVQGTVQKDERGAKIIADSIFSLAEAREKFTELIKVRLYSDKISRQRLEALKKILYQFHGNCPLLLTLHFSGKGEIDIDVMKDMTIRPCRELSDKVEELLGYQALYYRKRPIELNGRKKWTGNGKGRNGKNGTH
jgi:DNA polymerase-3 subunit alpha